MSKSIERIALPSMSPGTERYLKIHRYGKKGARPKAYLQASIHADEIPGMLAQHHLIAMLDAADAQGEIKGEIVLVPVANPIGLGQVINGTQAGRYELRGGGNFNRRWPDLSAGLAEAIAGKLTDKAEENVAIVRAAMGKALEEMSADAEFGRLRIALSRLAYDADYVLDLHCDDESLIHLFLLPQHWPDGADLAAEIGADAVLLCEDSGAQSFDETFSMPWIKLQKAMGGKHPIPAACLAATVEFRGINDVFDELAVKDASALFRFLQRRGLVAGNAGPLPAPKCEATMLDACDIVRTPVSGIIAYRVALGQKVAKGDVIADIVDPLADSPQAGRTEIRCATSGLILSRKNFKLAAAGDSITKVVGKEKLANRTGLLLED